MVESDEARAEDLALRITIFPRMGLIEMDLMDFPRSELGWKKGN